MADIDNCDGSNYLRRACDAGTGGGGGGGSEFNESLTNGDGIGILNYDGSVAKSIAVNSSVVRNTSDQVIAGGLTVEKLISNGPITGQGLDVSGVFTVEGDGSVGGSAPAATNVIAWDGAKWAPATAGGAASSSNLDLGYALNQSLRTSDDGQLSKLDLTGSTGLLSSGRVGIGTTSPSGALHVESTGGDDVIFKTSTATDLNVGLAAGDTSRFDLKVRDEDARLDIDTNSTTIISFRESGVGIGTTNPVSALELAGDDTIDARLSFSQTTASKSGTLQQGSQGLGISALGSNNNIFLATNGVQVLNVTSGYKVGIGTTSPSGALDVTGTILGLQSNDDDTLGSSAFYARSANPAISLLHTAGTKGVILSAKNGGDFAISTLNEDGTDFVQNVAVTTQGSVGIGTTAPDSKLEIRSDFENSDPLVNLYNEANATGKGLRVRAGNDDEDYVATFVNRAAVVGAPALHIRGDGYVGIGTTNPSAKLEVVGGAAIGGTVQIAADQADLTIDSSEENLIHLGNRSSVGVGLHQGYLRMKSSGVNTVNIDTSGVSYFNGGNVGIGATNPSQLLDIKGDAPTLMLRNTGATGTSSELMLGVADDRHSYIKSKRKDSGNSHSLEFGTNSGASSPETRMTIGSDGNVGIGTGDPSSLLHLVGTTNPEIRITDTDPGSAAAATFRAEDSSVTLGSYSNNPLYLVANNTTRMTVLSDGNVGIGTAAPQSQLNVAGSSSSSNGSQLRLSQEDAVNKQFNIGYHTGAAATQNVDYGKVEVYNASEPGGAKYMPLSLQPTSGSVVIGATEPQGLLGVSGDTYTQRLFITGAGGSWGQIGETLTGGDGINSFTYDALGGGEMGVSVDNTVLRTTDISQTILGDRNFTGTVTIGTLNVTGTQNIISTESLVSNGPTFTLNTGVGGTNSYDIGWVGERGSDLNIAVLWKEANDQFELISTSGISGGATNPSFSVSGYKGLKVGHLTNTGQATVKTSTPMGDLSVSGSTYSEELYITGIDGSWERVGVQGHDQASSFNTPLSAGSSVYTINFPKTFGAAPVVNTTVQNSAGGAIIPHIISGVGVSSYSVIFGSALDRFQLFYKY